MRPSDLGDEVEGNFVMFCVKSDNEGVGVLVRSIRQKSWCWEVGGLGEQPFPDGEWRVVMEKGLFCVDAL